MRTIDRGLGRVLGGEETSIGRQVFSLLHISFGLFNILTEAIHTTVSTGFGEHFCTFHRLGIRMPKRREVLFGLKICVQAGMTWKEADVGVEVLVIDPALAT